MKATKTHLNVFFKILIKKMSSKKLTFVWVNFSNSCKKSVSQKSIKAIAGEKKSEQSKCVNNV